MTKRKLNTAERNASRILGAADFEGCHITLKNTPNSTWGYTASVWVNGSRVSDIMSGCGYCKDSSALADALQWLVPEEGRYAIAKTGGAGISSVANALAKAGWRLLSVYATKRETIFSVKRVEA
jgi:hypothetical protein